MATAATRTQNERTGESHPLVGIAGLTVRFGERVVLEGVDLDVHAGEIITIVGPNGSGKSTLVKAIVGAVEPASGRISRSAGLTIGYVPQRLHIDPALPMTVRRFLALPGRGASAGAAGTLAQLGIDTLAGRQMAGLSGGQFQRALLARALIKRPRLLILDEATQGLDLPGAADFYDQIERARARFGCAVLMVSHDLAASMRRSDRLVCLNRRVRCAGAPAEVAAMSEYRALFGADIAGAQAPASCPSASRRFLLEAAQ